MITAGGNEKESKWLSQDLTELRHDDVTHQLEAILGKDDANQFLKPTIQDKPQKVVDQNITKRAGQIGAHNLWNSLRTHSQKNYYVMQKHMMMIHIVNITKTKQVIYSIKLKNINRK